LFVPLVALLRDAQVDDGPWTEATLCALACACFGHRHLWEDLGLESRKDVSVLLERHVPSLAARNTRNLRWKHFLFECLGDRLGVPDLRPPHCEGCGDFELCWGERPAVVRIESP